MNNDLQQAGCIRVKMMVCEDERLAPPITALLPLSRRRIPPFAFTSFPRFNFPIFCFSAPLLHFHRTHTASPLSFPPPRHFCSCAFHPSRWRVGPVCSSTSRVTQYEPLDSSNVSCQLCKPNQRHQQSLHQVAVDDWC